MGAEKAIDHYFQHLNIDKNKSNINKDMKKTGNRTGYHLTLAQCHAEHIAPAHGRSALQFPIPSQKNIASDAADIPNEKINGDSKHHREQDL